MSMLKNSRGDYVHVVKFIGGIMFMLQIHGGLCPRIHI